MSRVYWIVEHISRGPYICQARHPKTAKPMIVCRAESRSPAMIFPTQIAAAMEIDRIEPDNVKTGIFSIQPLNCA